MKCPSCNAEAPEGSARCPVCGAELAAQPETDPAAETVTAAEAAAPAQAAPAQAAPAHEAKKKEKEKHPEMDARTLEELSKPAGMFRFLGMLFVLTVPILNIVMLFKWGFGWGVNKNVRNYARAALLYALIMLILVILLWIVWPEGLTGISEFFQKLAAFKFISSK